MKKTIALLMAFMCVVGFSGCSDLEKEHFDKSLNADIEGINSIDETVNITIDPVVLGEGIISISNQLNKSYSEKSESESYNVWEEISKEDSKEFIDEIVNEMRIALDENKLFNLQIGVTGAINYDDMTADEIISCKFNNITLDVGTGYMRGNKLYIDKKLMYTLGAISFMYSTEALSSYYVSLDNIFGDKKYIVLDYSKLGSALGQQNFATSIVGSAIDINNKNIEYYNDAKDILKDFDTGCVKRIENGTRFELKPYDFVNVGSRFASYIRQHSEESAGLINNYMSMMNAITISMYGNLISPMTDIYGSNYTSEDVMKAMDSLNGIVNSKEFLIIFKTFDITYTDDVIYEGKSRNIAVTCSYNNKQALKYSVDVTTNKIDSYNFVSIDSNSAVGIDDLNNLLSSANNYSLTDYYICPECGEKFKFIDSRYCNKCGFVHDFYEGDENCDKQPGCEIANGVSVA